MADQSDNHTTLSWILACREEADQARRDRANRTKNNYDMFHLKHDFSHKQEGQSTEVLSKQSMAVESIRSFFQQALVDIGEWWKAEAAYPDAEATMAIRPHEITRMTNYMMEKFGYFSHVGNCIQQALLGSLAISKTYGQMIEKPKFVSKKSGSGKKLKRSVEKVDDDTWQLRFDTVQDSNFFPDPSGKGLYVIENIYLDYYEVLELATGDDAIYDKAAVEGLSRGSTADSLNTYERSRQTGQNTYSSGHRPKVKLTEFWGTILDATTGEVKHENCVATIANDMVFIREPTDNPLWHQKNPYTYSPLMEVANSVWHKAPMDAPTAHNRALIEIYNLLVDAAMKQVHAISQIRKDALDDPAQVANGIKPGATLAVNSMLPVGGKVLEPLTAVEIPAQAMNIFNTMSQEFNASAMTNDLRQGVMPFRAVKATEVVEASQTITSIFQGMAKNFETKHSMKELELAWETTAQNWDKISKEEFTAIFGKERGEQLSQLAPQDVFASTVNGIKFRVYGISLTLSKAQDFRKLTTLLQTVGSSQVLMEEFTKKYDFGKLLGEVMSSLDIDKDKLEIPQQMQATMTPPSPQGPGGPPPPGQPGQPPQQGPNNMSQVPQAGSGSLADIFGGGGPGIPHSHFPGSPATKGQHS